MLAAGLSQQIVMWRQLKFDCKSDLFDKKSRALKLKRSTWLRTSVFIAVDDR